MNVCEAKRDFLKAEVNVCEAEDSVYEAKVDFCEAKMNVCEAKRDFFKAEVNVCEAEESVCEAKKDFCEAKVDFCKAEVNVCEAKMEVCKADFNVCKAEDSVCEANLSPCEVGLNVFEAKMSGCEAKQNVWDANTNVFKAGVNLHEDVFEAKKNVREPKENVCEAGANVCQAETKVCEAKTNLCEAKAEACEVKPRHYHDHEPNFARNHFNRVKRCLDLLDGKIDFADIDGYDLDAPVDRQQLAERLKMRGGRSCDGGGNIKASSLADDDGLSSKKHAPPRPKNTKIAESSSTLSDATFTTASDCSLTEEIAQIGEKIARSEKTLLDMHECFVMGKQIGQDIIDYNVDIQEQQRDAVETIASVVKSDKREFASPWARPLSLGEKVDHDASSKPVESNALKADASDSGFLPMMQSYSTFLMKKEKLDHAAPSETCDFTESPKRMKKCSSPAAIKSSAECFNPIDLVKTLQLTSHEADNDFALHGRSSEKKQDEEVKEEESDEPDDKNTIDLGNAKGGYTYSDYPRIKRPWSNKIMSEEYTDFSLYDDDTEEQLFDKPIEASSGTFGSVHLELKNGKVQVRELPKHCKKAFGATQKQVRPSKNLKRKVSVKQCTLGKKPSRTTIDNRTNVKSSSSQKSLAKTKRKPQTKAKTKPSKKENVSVKASGQEKSTLVADGLAESTTQSPLNVFDKEKKTDQTNDDAEHLQKSFVHVDTPSLSQQKTNTEVENLSNTTTQLTSEGCDACKEVFLNDIPKEVLTNQVTHLQKESTKIEVDDFEATATKHQSQIPAKELQLELNEVPENKTEDEVPDQVCMEKAVDEPKSTTAPNAQNQPAKTNNITKSESETKQYEKDEQSNVPLSANRSKVRDEVVLPDVRDKIIALCRKNNVDPNKFLPIYCPDQAGPVSKVVEASEIRDEPSSDESEMDLYDDYRSRSAVCETVPPVSAKQFGPVHLEIKDGKLQATPLAAAFPADALPIKIVEKGPEGSLADEAAGTRGTRDPVVSSPPSGEEVGDQHATAAAPGTIGRAHLELVNGKIEVRELPKHQEAVVNPALTLLKQEEPKVSTESSLLNQQKSKTIGDSSFASITFPPTKLPLNTEQAADLSNNYASLETDVICENEPSLNQKHSKTNVGGLPNTITQHSSESLVITEQVVDLLNESVSLEIDSVNGKVISPDQKHSRTTVDDIVNTLTPPIEVLEKTYQVVDLINESTFLQTDSVFEYTSSLEQKQSITAVDEVLETTTTSQMEVLQKSDQLVDPIDKSTDVDTDSVLEEKHSRTTVDGSSNTNTPSSMGMLVSIRQAEQLVDPKNEPTFLEKDIVCVGESLLKQEQPKDIVHSSSFVTSSPSMEILANEKDDEVVTPTSSDKEDHEESDGTERSTSETVFYECMSELAIDKSDDSRSSVMLSDEVKLELDPSVTDSYVTTVSSERYKRRSTTDLSKETTESVTRNEAPLSSALSQPGQSDDESAAKTNEFLKDGLVSKELVLDAEDVIESIAEIKSGENNEAVVEINIKVDGIAKEEDGDQNQVSEEKASFEAATAEEHQLAEESCDINIGDHSFGKALWSADSQPSQVDEESHVKSCDELDPETMTLKGKTSNKDIFLGSETQPELGTIANINNSIYERLFEDPEGVFNFNLKNIEKGPTFGTVPLSTKSSVILSVYTDARSCLKSESGNIEEIDDTRLTPSIAEKYLFLDDDSIQIEALSSNEDHREGSTYGNKAASKPLPISLESDAILDDDSIQIEAVSSNEDHREGSTYDNKAASKPLPISPEGDAIHTLGDTCKDEVETQVVNDFFKLSEGVESQDINQKHESIQNAEPKETNGACKATQKAEHQISDKVVNQFIEESGSQESSDVKSGLQEHVFENLDNVTNTVQEPENQNVINVYKDGQELEWVETTESHHAGQEIELESTSSLSDAVRGIEYHSSSGLCITAQEPQQHLSGESNAVEEPENQESVCQSTSNISIAAKEPQDHDTSSESNSIKESECQLTNDVRKAELDSESQETSGMYKTAQESELEDTSDAYIAEKESQHQHTYDAADGVKELECQSTSDISIPAQELELQSNSDKCETAQKSELKSTSDVSNYVSELHDHQASHVTNALIEPNCQSTTSLRISAEEPECQSNSNLCISVKESDCESTTNLCNSTKEPEFQSRTNVCIVLKEPECKITNNLCMSVEEPESQNNADLCNSLVEPECEKTTNLCISVEEPDCGSTTNVCKSLVGPECPSNAIVCSSVKEPKSQDTSTELNAATKLKTYSTSDRCKTAQKPECENTGDVCNVVKEPECQNTKVTCAAVQEPEWQSTGDVYNAVKEQERQDHTDAIKNIEESKHKETSDVPEANQKVESNATAGDSSELAKLKRDILELVKDLRKITPEESEEQQEQQAAPKTSSSLSSHKPRPTMKFPFRIASFHRWGRSAKDKTPPSPPPEPPKNERKGASNSIDDFFTTTSSEDLPYKRNANGTKVDDGTFVVHHRALDTESIRTISNDGSGLKLERISDSNCFSGASSEFLTARTHMSSDKVASDTSLAARVAPGVLKEVYVDQAVTTATSSSVDTLPHQKSQNEIVLRQTFSLISDVDTGIAINVKSDGDWVASSWTFARRFGSLFRDVLYYADRMTTIDAENITLLRGLYGRARDWKSRVMESGRRRHEAYRRTLTTERDRIDQDTAHDTTYWDTRPSASGIDITEYVSPETLRSVKKVGLLVFCTCTVTSYIKSCC